MVIYAAIAGRKLERLNVAALPDHLLHHEGETLRPVAVQE